MTKMPFYFSNYYVYDVIAVVPKIAKFLFLFKLYLQTQIHLCTNVDCWWSAMQVMIGILRSNIQIPARFNIFNMMKSPFPFIHV